MIPLQGLCDRWLQTARLMVGVPDYQTYVEHRRKTHPDLPVDDLRGVFPRPPAGPLRAEQGPVPAAAERDDQTRAPRPSRSGAREPPRIRLA